MLLFHTTAPVQWCSVGYRSAAELKGDSLAEPDPLLNAKWGKGSGQVRGGAVQDDDPRNSWEKCGVNQDTKLEPVRLLLRSQFLLSWRMKLLGESES